MQTKREAKEQGTEATGAPRLGGRPGGTSAQADPLTAPCAFCGEMHAKHGLASGACPRTTAAAIDAGRATYRPRRCGRPSCGHIEAVHADGDVPFASLCMVTECDCHEFAAPAPARFECSPGASTNLSASGGDVEGSSGPADSSVPMGQARTWFFCPRFNEHVSAESIPSVWTGTTPFRDEQDARERYCRPCVHMRGERGALSCALASEPTCLGTPPVDGCDCGLPLQPGIEPTARHALNREPTTPVAPAEVTTYTERGYQRAVTRLAKAEYTVEREEARLSRVLGRLLAARRLARGLRRKLAEAEEARLREPELPAVRP